MMQIYFLTIIYLLFGAGIFLVDYYGGTLLVFIRLRNAIRTNRKVQIILIICGLLLAIVKILFPIPPGPAVFGDFFPVLWMIVLSVYYTVQLRKQVKGIGTSVSKDDVFKKTGSIIEIHKRNLGILIGVSTILHFFVPQAVLL